MANLLERFNQEEGGIAENHRLFYPVRTLTQMLGAFQSPEIGYLLREWMNGFGFIGVDEQSEAPQISQNVWVRSLKAIPFAIGSLRPVTEGGAYSVDHPPLAKFLVQAMAPLVSTRESRSVYLRELENIEAMGARILERDDFPKLLSDAESVFNRSREIHAQKVTTNVARQEVPSRPDPIRPRAM
jgi:hypothetical protein